MDIMTIFAAGPMLGRRLARLAGLFALLVGLPLATLTPPAGAAAVRHLRLVASSPEADAELARGPDEIRLFFSESPEIRGTTVRLTIGADQLVPASAAAADPADPTQVFIRPEAPLAPGGYTVHWRVIARDGHTQRGTFDFRIATQ